jgi:hypothetical protein
LEENFCGRDFEENWAGITVNRCLEEPLAQALTPGRKFFASGKFWALDRLDEPG